MIKIMSIDKILKDLANGKCEIRQAKQCLFILIENLVPKRYDSDPAQDEYERGMECAYRTIEKRIEKLK